MYVNSDINFILHLLPNVNKFLTMGSFVYTLF